MRLASCVAIPKSRSTGLKHFALGCQVVESACRNPQIPVYGTETSYIIATTRVGNCRNPQIPVYGTETLILEGTTADEYRRNPQIPVYGTETFERYVPSTRHPRVAIPKSRSTGLKLHSQAKEP